MLIQLSLTGNSQENLIKHEMDFKVWKPEHKCAFNLAET